MNKFGLWTRLKQRKSGIKRKGIMRVSTFNRKQIIIPKPIMPIIVTETEFQKFRGKLHKQFKNLADSAMELLDALCSNNKTASVVQLSLNPLFRRGHSALFKAIGALSFGEVSNVENGEGEDIKPQEMPLLELIAEVVPKPEERRFYLLGLDCTSVERQYAKTLADRGMVYQPTQIKGNKPITIGHSYSMLAVIPERKEGDAPWTIPLDMSRVSTESNSNQKGIEQLKAVLSNPKLAWSKELCVSVVDSAYGNKQFLSPLQEHTNLVTVARSRSNRVFYQSPVISETPVGRGHPTWYGARFDTKEPDTWHEPTAVSQLSYKTRSGRIINVTITAWANMLMRGGKATPTHKAPFTLLRIESFDDAGQSLFKPMWLIVIGERRGELSALQAYHSYRQRFDLEHTFRFGKQNLLLNTFATPDVEHEQQWVKFVMLAYVQLWAAHSLAVSLPRPWEKHLLTVPSARISPSKVQQDWFRIISQLGSPAVSPQPRGYSSGRKSGEIQSPRPRLSVIKKRKSPASVPKIPA
jgi:DDE superfamily endonuclease